MTKPTALPDEELFALLKRELFTSVVGDVMDRMGLRRQYLPPAIRPLAPEMVLVGRALPVLEADFYSDRSAGAGPFAAEPFGLMFAALDDLQRGEVYLASGVTGHYAMWGEMMTSRAMILGAAGAVLNGYSRDTRGILTMGFSVFSHGSYGQDQAVRGKVVDFRCPIEVGGVRVESGDILFGDMDGVLAIPRAAEDEVLRLALEKARGEKAVAKAIAEGMPASEAWKTFGIM